MGISGVQDATLKPATYTEAARPAEDAPKVTAEAVGEENQDQVLLSPLEKKEEPEVVNYSDMVQKYQGLKTSKPKDSSGQLTARLVAAVDELEVQAVISKAGSNLMGLRMVAVSGEPEDKEKAKQYIRKLEKLISRGTTKIKELREEASLSRQQKTAEKAKQERRANEIKAELRHKQRVRKAKEERYLREGKMEDLMAGKSAAGDALDRMDAATEAEIAVEAEAMAAAEMAAGDVGGGGEAAGGDVAAAGAEAPAPAEGGGEGVDISV